MTAPDPAAEALANAILRAFQPSHITIYAADALIAAEQIMDDVRAGQVPGVEAGGWRPIEEAPKDGTEFLSCGGIHNNRNEAIATRWLSPGPYTTENGKNTPGERRYRWPDGFYWAGYDGFVGPVDPTHFRPLPAPPQGA